MSREWKPGDPLVLWPECEPWASNDGIAAFMDELVAWWPRRPNREIGMNGRGTAILSWLADTFRSAEFRPLVVIDPEDESVAEAICKAFVAAGVWRVIPAEVEDMHAYRREQVQAALRELAAPKPRIEEPGNWLSVIRDNEGIEWYRWSVRPKDRDQAWVSVWDEGRCYPTGWDDINAVEIISGGIESIS